MNWIAAGDGINVNYRFSQPGRSERNRQEHLYVEGVLPFGALPASQGETHRPLRALHAALLENLQEMY